MRQRNYILDNSESQNYWRLVEQILSECCGLPEVFNAKNQIFPGCRRGRDGMVFGFTTTCLPPLKS
jgi:hypothetical protein